MNKSLNNHETHTQKKQSQLDFFDHYNQFTLLINRIESILLGKMNKNFEGNEIRKSVTLLDQITQDLQGVGILGGNISIVQEEYAQELLHRWAEKTGNSSQFSDIYAALEKIYSLDGQIAKEGIIPLDTSIFHTPKTKNRIVPSGNGNTFESPKTADKYVLFCQAFQSVIFSGDNKLSLQDCMIYEEKLEGEGRMREIPYKIIYIPEVHKTLQIPFSEKSTPQLIPYQESPFKKVSLPQISHAGEIQTITDSSRIPVMQTWCISDEIGQAIYIYDGHPLLETIIRDMKGGYIEHNSQKLEWKKSEEDIKNEMIHILQNGIQGSTQISGVPTEDMKLKLWAQKSLMEGRDFLDSIGMIYLGRGKWDLRNMKGSQVWNELIGVKQLKSFPSTTWNKLHNIGDKIGTLTNSTHIAHMLISIGYKSENIAYTPQKIDPFEWKNGIDKERYKLKARQELEKSEYKTFLDSIGMFYLGEGKWDLKNMKGNKSWNKSLGGKLFSCFPSTTWNKLQKSGNIQGILQNTIHIIYMLISIGYKKEDIFFTVDPLAYKDGMDEEEYKLKARQELEKSEYKLFLDEIGMLYLGNEKWDLKDMKCHNTWNKSIGGRKLSSFPSSIWNKFQNIGSNRGIFTNATHIANMLLSIGYKKENISYTEQKEDPLEYKDGMDKEEYKLKARIELEKSEYKLFLDEIGMLYLGNEKWDLKKMKGKSKWQENIGEKQLKSFPSTGWNNIHAIGDSYGKLNNSTHIRDMLVSIGYKKENIIYTKQKEDPLEWRDGINEEKYKTRAREELEKSEYKVFLDDIGMKYFGEGKWDLKKMSHQQKWRQYIGEKQLRSFPGCTWNKLHNIGDKTGTLQNPVHIASMLISIGYKRENIDYNEQKEDPFEWRDGMNEEEYKARAREELEKEENKVFLNEIEMFCLGEGKWNLENMKGNSKWTKDIGVKKLQSFPSAVWNKLQKVTPTGALSNFTHVADMLVSIGYQAENIKTR